MKYTDPIADTYNQRFVNTKFVKPYPIFDGFIHGAKIRNFPAFNTMDNITNEEIELYKTNLIESSKILLPDKTHDNLHDWLIHTETNNYMDHPVESHADFTNHQYGISMKIRDSMLIDTHPMLAKSHLSNLLDHDIKRVYDYVHVGLEHNPSMRSGSAFINDSLYDARHHGISPPKAILHPNGVIFDIHHFDSILRKNRNPYDEFSTYSGIAYDPSTKTDSTNVLNSPHYLSSSTRRATAARYSMHDMNSSDMHILHIIHTKDTPGLYLGNNPMMTKYKDDEYILPRNSSLKLNGKHTYKSTYNGIQRNFHVWNAHVINDF